MNKIDELSQYWAERLWEIRPLDGDYPNKKKDEFGLRNPVGLLVYRNTEKSIKEMLEVFAPQYTADFGACLDIIKYLQAKGAWVNISSPFIPNDEHKPVNKLYWKQWEESRNHWWVSVDFHGTTDTHPIWQASDENPARAICDAGRQWMEHIESND